MCYVPKCLNGWFPGGSEKKEIYPALLGEFASVDSVRTKWEWDVHIISSPLQETPLPSQARKVGFLFAFLFGDANSSRKDGCSWGLFLHRPLHRNTLKRTIWLHPSVACSSTFFLFSSEIWHGILIFKLDQIKWIFKDHRIFTGCKCMALKPQTISAGAIGASWVELETVWRRRSGEGVKSVRKKTCQQSEDKSVCCFQLWNK